MCRAPVWAYDWQPPPNKVVVLAVCAHPDDEGIFFGGALPYYSSVLSLPTMLLCTTAGWGTVRDNELRCAAWTYGLRYEPLFGHFTDINSGAMTNTPYGTNTINVTWDYWAGVGFRGDGTNAEAGKARAINYVAEQIRRYRPDVIITHDLNGETGHDNHKATAYAVTQAFFVAADPNATAPNLIGLPPWQAQKLYVHLYPTNRLFHEFWETPYPALTNQTSRQVGHIGLTCHVSQTPFRWNVASLYDPANYYSAWPSEWWGLYASTVGPDTVLSSNAVVNGYLVPGGVAAGNFLEHLSISVLYFTAIPHSATVPAGCSITLSAAAATTGSPLCYQWQLNGAVLGGATDNSLTFSNVQPINAGSYSVVVTNSAGSLTSPAAVLTVVVPPVVNCAANKSMQYTDAWDFDAPSPMDLGGTNTITVLSTTTNWTCGATYVATRAWQAVDAFGNSATCTQVVTVVDTTPPVILCPSNLTVACSSPWSFGTPLAADSGLGGALVFDNSVNDLVTRFESGANEVGNEIILAGDERYLLGFSYEFWSTNLTGLPSFAGTNVTVRLRFYANDGTDFHGYPTPGTLLFDSGEFELGLWTTPRATVVYDEFDLWLYALYPLADALPADFTWTVQFSGLGANDRAGVDLYSPPVVGQSYGDFWLRTNGGWELRMTPELPADIAARATASTNRVVITELSTVTNAIPGGGFVVTRTWRATDACGNFSDCSQTVTVPAQADLSVEIVSSASPALLGTNLICTVTVSNGGPSTATGVIVSNFLTSLTEVAVTNGLTGSGKACPFPGPAAWWPAEYNASDVANGHNGTVAGGVTYVGGKVGLAFSFDGTTGSVSVPDAPGLRPQALTIEGWVRVQNVAGVHVLIGKRLGAGTNDSYSLGFASGVLFAAIADEAGTSPLLTYSPPLAEWFHVAYAFDPATQVQALYVNGALVNAGFVTKIIAYDTHPVLIGADDNNGSPGFFYQGQIDDLTLYSRALSGTEIQAIHHAGGAGKCQTPGGLLLGDLASGATAQVSLVAAPVACLTASASASVTSPACDASAANNVATVSIPVQGLPPDQLWLTIQRVSLDSQRVRISWPVTCEASVLEEATDNLNAPVTWSPAGVPVQTTDDRNCAVVPSGTGNKYFRLKLP